MNSNWQLFIIPLMSIFGSGFAAYIGVRVALAEIKKDIETIRMRQEELSRRIDRLELPYFKDDK